MPEECREARTAARASAWGLVAGSVEVGVEEGTAVEGGVVEEGGAAVEERGGGDILWEGWLCGF